MGASQVAQWWGICFTVQETWVQFLGQEDTLEKEMSTHSDILAWKIPWTEEPGRVQSMGLQGQTWLNNNNNIKTPLLHTWAAHIWNSSVTSMRANKDNFKEMRCNVQLTQISRYFDMNNYNWKKWNNWWRVGNMLEWIIQIFALQYTFFSIKK